MKKTGRIMLVLLVVAVASFLLYPTVKWYCFTPEATKQLAAGSNLQIREYSRGQASRDVRVLMDKALNDGEGEVSPEYKYLEKVAKENLKAKGKSVPSKWTWYSMVATFASEGDLFDAIEEEKRTEIMNVKNLSS